MMTDCGFVSVDENLLKNHVALDLGKFRVSVRYVMIKDLDEGDDEDEIVWI